MKKQLGSIIPAIALLVGAVGCESDSQPFSETPVVMHLEIQPSADGLVAKVTIKNQAFYPVKYWSGCGCGISLWVVDGHGNRVLLYCGPEPACPCHEANLSPGEEKVGGLLFQGLRCVGGELGTMEPVELGQYEIVASFSYDGPTNSRVYQNIEDHIDFVWPGAKEH